MDGHMSNHLTEIVALSGLETEARTHIAPTLLKYFCSEVDARAQNGSSY